MWVGVNFGLYRLRPSAPNRAVQAHSVGIGYDVLRAWHPTKPKEGPILRSFNCE
jgi:hypothetical protein